MVGWTCYHAHVPHPSQHTPSKGVLTSLLAPQSLLATGLLSQPPDSRPHRADLGVRVVRDGAGEEEVKGVQSPERKVGTLSACSRSLCKSPQQRAGLTVSAFLLSTS